MGLFQFFEDVGEAINEGISNVLSPLFEPWAALGDAVGAAYEQYYKDLAFQLATPDQKILMKFRRGDLEDYKIIGKKEAELIYDGKKILSDTQIEPGDILIDVFDTDEKPNASLIRLRNDAGEDVQLSGVAVRCKIILGLSGRNGYESEPQNDPQGQYRDGLKPMTIENSMIIDQEQIKDLHDYYWKQYGAGEPKKHFYALGIRGRRHDLTPGKNYTIVVGEPGEPEFFNVNARLEQLSIQGGTNNGATIAIFREYAANWVRTLDPTIRNTSDGNPARVMRGGAVRVVGSSTYTSDADYLCDGTDDHIEIQAAIDELAGIGGGTVQLTNGQFNPSDDIRIYGNISVAGTGDGTLYNVTDSTQIFLGVNKSNQKDDGQIRDVKIIGEKNRSLITGSTNPNLDGKDHKSHIINISIEGTYGGTASAGVAIVKDIDTVQSLYINNSTIEGYIVADVGNISDYRVKSCTITDTTNLLFRGGNISSVRIEDITGQYILNAVGALGATQTLSGMVVDDIDVRLFVGVRECTSVSNVSITNIITSDGGFVGFEDCSNLTSNDINNVSANSGLNIFGYASCKKINSCTANNMTNTGGGLVYGFAQCNTMTSNSSTSPYLNSYADSTNVYPASDTPNGGFNS